MTPLSNATTPSEQAYNTAHTKTRAVIERCFGLLKSRFRCLDRSGGTLLYTPEKTCQLITAAAVLHNFCISRHLPAPVDVPLRNYSLTHFSTKYLKGQIILLGDKGIIVQVQYVP